MSPSVGYTLDQLMELAALSCASAIEHFFPKRSKVLVVCGPGSQCSGSRLSTATAQSLVALCCARRSHSFSPAPRPLCVDNGGDGLVCARHLKLFGYSPTVVLPKEPKSDFFRRLVTQLRTLDIPIVAEMPAAADASASFPLIVDAVFGFSFDPKDGVREPYKGIIEVGRGGAGERCGSDASQAPVQLSTHALTLVPVCMSAFSAWSPCNRRRL